MAASMETRPDILLADFEGDDWGGWTIEGTAFGTGPAHDALPGQADVTGYLGGGYASSFHGGDPALGRLISPPFTVQRRYLSFLIGGGRHTYYGNNDPGYVAVNLVHEGHVVRTAPRSQWAPDGCDHLAWDWFDLADLAGTQVRVEVVDQHTGPWGHILVDQFAQTDAPPVPLPSFAERRFRAGHRFLNLPISLRSPYRELQLTGGGRTVASNTVSLATGDPDFWVPVDLSAWKGMDLTLRIEELDDAAAPPAADLLTAVRIGDRMVGCDDLFREPGRPLLHYTPRRGASSDANGLVWLDGEWHLHYQHVPCNVTPGNQNCNWGWGHAVSRDLVTWEELPDTLWPDERGVAVSGSCVVDHHNSSGLGSPGRPPMVIFYTAYGGSNRLSHGRSVDVCIVYSTDRGRTWRPYDGNPVIRNIDRGNRDAKVFWYEAARHWVMVLYIHNDVHFIMTSTDLLHWQFRSQVPGMHECPELFELPVIDEPGTSKWVFFGASCDYYLGTFDGTRFVPETDIIRFKYTDGSLYASQTFNDAPDGRRILVAKGQVSGLNPMLNSLITFPIELTLRRTDEGLRIHQNPVAELDRLRTDTVSVPDLTMVSDDAPLTVRPAGRLLDIELELTLAGARALTLEIFGKQIRLDLQAMELQFHEALEDNDIRAPLSPVDGRLDLRLLVDTIFLEIFSARGRYYTPVRCAFPQAAGAVRLRTTGGAARVDRMRIHELRSIWEQPDEPGPQA
jgi:fructan beta-fructosidase